jgi:hypothetical protein
MGTAISKTREVLQEECYESPYHWEFFTQDCERMSLFRTLGIIEEIYGRIQT